VPWLDPYNGTMTLVDIDQPALDPLRTLASEDSCLANNPQGFAGHPVNTRTGNFTHQEVDVTIPTRGLPLTFQRSYNSLDTYAGPLGHGWTHNYNVHLEVISDTVTLMAPLGSRLEFTDNGDDTFTASPGVRATLVRNADDTYTLTRGDQIVYTFDATGRLTSLADANGNTTTLTYTGDSLTAITAPDGRALTLAYDGQGRITQLTDPLNRTVSYAYDDAGNLVSVTDALGHVTTYAYDDSHRLTVITDANGHTYTNTYDDQGRVISQSDALGYATTFTYDESQTIVTDANGQATTYTYDGVGLLESVTDALGNTTTYTYDQNYNRTAVTDPLGRTTTFTWNECGCGVTSITDPLGEVTTMTYDGRNNLTSRTDPLGRTMSFTYDDHDNLTAITDPLGHVTTFTYDAYGQMLSTTDANGIATTYEYDALNRLHQVTDALNGVTTYAYDAVGNLLSATDANGHTTTYEYNALNRLHRVTDALSGQVVYTYDAVGNRTAVTDANGHTTTYEYDALNRLHQVTDPLGNTTQYGYDAVSNLTVITDANGIATTYEYDALNRLHQVTDALNGVTTYAYDAVGNRTAITDANGHVTTYEYDALNRLHQMTDPLGHTWTYTYDAVGNQISTQDANGATVNYAYDAVNRLITMDYPAPQGDVSFAYDAVGNRLTMTDSTGTTTYEYDALNRLHQVTQPGSLPVSYTYDAVGNRTRLTYPGGGRLDYTYNALNRLATISSPDIPDISILFTYDPAGRLLQMRDAANTAVSTYTYDDGNRLLSIVHADGNGLPAASFSYTYDAVGNRTQAVEMILGQTVTINYGYDDLYRLTSAIYSSGENYAYTYDAVGNRLSLTTGGGVVNYTYDAANRLTNVNGVAYTWDNNGNLLSDGVRTFTYDAADRLVAVSGGGVNAAYTYNGDGLRVLSTVNGVPTPYVWDVAAGLPQVLMEGAYAYAYGHALLARLDLNTEQLLAYGLDGLGSIRLLVDGDTRQIVDTYRYAPFGGLLAGGVSDNNRRFTGETQDPTGLYYLRARYYDPTTGRFLTKDPFPGFAALTQSQNPYAYTMNNPVLFVDPSGQVVWIPTILAIGTGLGGLANLGVYFLNTPGCARTWQGALTAFGKGAVAGLVGTGATMAMAAFLPAIGVPLAPVWIGVISGGFGGAVSTGTLNVLERRPWYSGLIEGTVVGGVSGGIAAMYTPTRPGPAPRLSWTQGWPLGNAYVGPKSMDIVIEEIAQDTIGAVMAIMLGQESPPQIELLPPDLELQWSAP
jgi:RHS repeat-associated protein